MRDLVVSGLGVTSAIGHGKAAFLNSLLEGRHGFRTMRRPGRQWPLPGAAVEDGTLSTNFLGAEIDDLALPPDMPRSLLRTASLSAQVAVTTLHEAWQEARLQEADPARIGLFVGGSNLQQREQALVQAGDARRFQFLRPTYGMAFMDSDISAICSEAFGIKGFALTLGGASASGQVAVLHAIEAVKSGQVDVCVALGAMMDLSCWELQGFHLLGAMGSQRFAAEPAAACRPFDKDRDGFIFGENCGVVVVEAAHTAARRGTGVTYARLAGWAIRGDGNRNPNPSLEGEIGVIQAALSAASWSASDVDYVNPHASGSMIGDETELEALRRCGVSNAYANTTKSVCGHGLSAAGAVELVATLLQMQAGRLHPSRNLETPMDAPCRLVQGDAIAHRIQCALKLSFGFGGVNTALCLERI